jgi:benzylsuccinate CoA-transferase BbsF subunit
VAVFNDSEWEALCAVMGRPSWSRRQCFKTAVGRKSNEAELDRLIVTWTEQNGAFRLMKTLQEAGVSAGVVQNSQDLHQDPQLGVRRHFYSVDHPVMGRHFVQQNEARFQEEITYSRSPLLGEHTAKICSDIIGLSEEEFARGKEEGLFT